MNPTPHAHPARRLLLALTCTMALAPSVWSQTKSAATDPTPPADKNKVPTETTPAASDKKEDTVVLSPFVVSTQKDSGYFAENTLAGSRINTNLGDLAASITVVTKQQMEDTASLDINDIFKYEASTEGSSTYSTSIVDRGTVKDVNAGYSFGNNGATTTNAQSNRIRGLNAPDAAINNYSTNNRIPFDDYNIQSVEISRGPNSLLFGLGTPSGVVNANTAQADLQKNTETLTLRTDQNGTFRTSFSFNVPIIRDMLGIYGAVLYDDRQFERKPSHDLYRREYAAMTFKPFKKTTISANVEGYLNNANRPNFFVPRDQVTPWLQAGMPAYNALTRQVTIQGAVNVPAGVLVPTRAGNGQVLGTYVSDARSPGYVASVNTILGANALTNLASPLWVGGIAADNQNGNIARMLDISGNTWGYFQRALPAFYAPAQTNPATAVPSGTSLGWTTGNSHWPIADRMWTESNFWPAPTPIINGSTTTNGLANAYSSYNFPGVTNKAIYDWTKYNTLTTNFATVKAGNYNIEFQQEILPNLNFSAGWFRQDIREADNYTLNQLQGATLIVDTNLYLLDGTRNPYFGKPFIVEGQGGGVDTFYNPQTDDNYRALLVYELDLTKRNGWMRWLGRHRFIGTAQEQDSLGAIERWRMNVIDGDADAKLRFTRNLTLTNQASWSATSEIRHYYMAQPGDPEATVTHSIAGYFNQGWQSPVTSGVNVWNYNTGNFQTDQITEGTLFSDAGSFKTQREVKGTQFAMQNYLWEDRLITTFGWRHDDYRARITTTGAITDRTGKVVEGALTPDRDYLTNSTGIVNRDLVMNRWNHWDKLSGDTKTLSGAFRPLKDWSFVERMGDAPLGEFLNGLTFYMNASSNFNPPGVAQTDYFLKPLPKPTGNEHDFGVGFNLFKNKLVARVTWYKTENQNERTSAATTLLTRLAYSDTTTGLAWAATVERIHMALAAGKTLNGLSDPNSIFQNTGWNTDAVWNTNTTAEQQKLYDMIKLPYNYYAGINVGATQQSSSKGTELQVTFNPTNSWTMKLTASKDEALYTSVAPEYDAWKAVRMPVWTSLSSDVPDFIDPNNGRHFSLKNFWTGYGFTNVAYAENTDGNTSAQNYYNNVVESLVATAKAPSRPTSASITPRS